MDNHKTNPSISVIVPNLNGGESLLETLNAIVMSVPANTEIWLVDDGSTDGSPEQVHAEMPQIHILTFEQSHGAAFARNQGFQHATGQVLFCVDADVLCQPHCLTHLLNALQAADIVFPKLVSPKGTLLNPQTPFARSRCLNSAIFGIRRQALARMDRYFDEIIEIYGEDNDFFLRAHRLGLTLRYVPEAQATHPHKVLLGERHYYMTVRNAIYVWLKLRHLVSWWLPIDVWMVTFLIAHLIGALLNRSLAGWNTSPPIRYTRRGRRLHLVTLFMHALIWNVRHLRTTLEQRHQFQAFIQ